MREGRRAGRPRAASREILEEAACELFLEQGYAETSVADITQRAGVSRNTFFNYIGSKSDLLWTSVDDAVEQLAAQLAHAADRLPGGGDDVSEESGAAGDGRHDDLRDGLGDREAAVEEVRSALLRLAAHLEPGTVVLAFANAEPMGVAEELEESAARRQRRAATVIGGHLRRRGLPELEAEVVGAALAGALLAALRAWARSGPGRTSLAQILGEALGVVSFSA